MNHSSSLTKPEREPNAPRSSLICWRRGRGLALFLALASALALVVPACAKWAPQAPSRNLQFTQKVHQFKSNHGMRILVVEDPSVDTVEVDMRVFTGSVADPPGKEGLAHLVEHLMFEVRPGGPGTPSLAEALDDVSLSSNATTTWDYTHYQSLGRIDALDQLIAIQAARLRFQCAQITDEMIEQEREIVRNELRQRFGSGDAQVAMQLGRAIYGDKHPYHRAPGGDEESLMRITRADVCGFVFQHYRANNTLLSVHGGVTRAQAMAVMERHLSAVKGRKAIAPAPSVPPWTPAYIGRRSVAVPIEDPIIAMVVPMPWKHAENGFMARLLLNDFVWFLGQDKPGYITDIDSLSLGGARAPVGAVALQLDSNDAMDKAIEFVRGKLRAYRKRDSFDFRDNANSQRYYEGRANSEVTDLLRRIEPVAGRGDIYADFAQFSGDEEYVIGAMNRTSQVTGRRMAALRNQLFDPDTARFVALIEDSEAEVKYQRVVLFRPPGAHGASSWRLPVDLAEAERDARIPARRSVLGDARQFTLKSGLRVYMLSDLTFPLARVQLEFAAGTIHEPKGQGGLSLLSAYMVGSGGIGARMDTASDEEFTRLGTTSDSDVDTHETVYYYQGQSRFIDMMIHRLDRQVRGKYSKKVFAKVRERLADRLNRESMLGALSRAQVIAEAIYGRGHPYATREYVSNESMARLNVDAIDSFRNRHYRAKNGTLVIVGQFDPQLIEQHVRFSFDDWSGKAALDQPDVGPSTRPREAVYLAVTPPAPRVQVDVSVTYPTAVGVDKNHAARLVVEAMLEQRLERIREELGVSYGVQSWYRTSVGPGHFEISGDVDSLRAGAALKVVQQSVASLHSTDDAFRRDFIIARRRVAQRLLSEASDSARLTWSLAFIARHDLPLDYMDRLPERVARLRPADIERVVKAELAPDMATVVLTGGRAYIEAAYREVGIANPRFVQAGTEPATRVAQGTRPEHE